VLDGRDLANVPPQERDVAMVFQGYALYPHLRVRDNIAFPLRMRRVGKPERERKVSEAAELLGLRRLLDRRPAELSGGEQQRVAMARALVRSPRLFLFDEPLSNLDAKLRAELRVELAALVRRLGTTALYVTHDQAEAMTMADRVAVLRGGRLQQLGPPREIYERPANAFVAGFLGTPTMNLLELRCRNGLGEAPGVEVRLPATLGRRAAVTLGVRPEQVQVEPDEPHSEVEADAVTTTALRCDAVVVATEPLGAESYVHLDVRGTRLRSRVAGLDAPTAGSRIGVRVARSALHWFDADDGARLEPADGGSA
jgi:multiple sugar transport system ATP-binding protein